MTPRLHVLPDPAELAEAAARFLAEAIGARDAERYSVCLSGGHTPRATYARLAEPPWREKLPWHRMHFFFTDERDVPPDDQRSNARMVRETLFAPLAVPKSNIHAVPTQSGDPDAAADAYDAILKRFFGRDDPARGGPVFDVMLLGLGEDGHTASLFPRNPALAESGRWAVAVRDPGVPEPRISLTLPALQVSRHTAFLVSGDEKRASLKGLLEGDPALPAARVAPVAGGLDIFADRAAAVEGEP